MFGVSKEQLVKGLCRVSTSLCGYMGHMCDCKYMQNSDDFGRGSEQTGCPETAMAATLINSMTTQEFYAIARRAGIQVSLPEDPEVKIGDFMRNLQDQRDGARQREGQAITAAKAAKKAAKK